MDDVDVLDVRVMSREHLRDAEQHSRLIGNRGQDGMRRHTRKCTTTLGIIAS